MMKKQLLLAGLPLIALMLGVLPAMSQESSSPMQDRVGLQKLRKLRHAIPNQYIVVLRQTVSQDERNNIIRSFRQSSHQILKTYSAALNGFAIRMSEQEAEELSNDERVDFIEEDGLMTISQNSTSLCTTIAVDGHIPLCGAQGQAPWHIDRINQPTNTTDGYYGIGGTGQNINVYVLDTGIRTTHSDFQGRATSDYNAINDGNGSTDCNGHGTFVAATIGGNQYGIAKKANLRSVRVLDCTGTGTASNIIAGINWITANVKKPALVNVSLGSSTNSSVDSAVQTSINSGITYVIAAGNNNADASGTSPARVTAAITVGAMDQNAKRASFSNYGSVVDFYAPGVNIYSAFKSSDTSQAMSNGTSFSAPIIAGMAAIELEWNPYLSPSGVYTAVYNKIIYSFGTTSVGSPSSSSTTSTATPTPTSTNNGSFKTFGTPIYY
jgi:aqualysin 1